ncbi:MAG: RNA polymerase sigma factor [Planctomycetota bacterium]
MEARLSQRPNDEWVAAIRNPEPGSQALLEELQAYLHRALRKILRRHEYLTDEDYQDLGQEAFLKLVEYLHTFRGDSAFPTWATSVATRVAFTELRKRSARDKGQRTFEQAREHALSAPSTEDVVSKHQLVQALHEAIEAELSDRQRVAILAELRGVPTIEVARQLDTNQNALYKLVHDGRKKLRRALGAAGFQPELIHEFVEGASER